MSSISHANVTPVQPYRPPPLNLVQALPLPPPPQPLGSSGAMTFDINNPTAFAVHAAHPPPLTYHAPLQTHRTPTLSDSQLNQHHQHQHQHQHQQLSHHVQTTATFHAQQNPDEPLKKRQRLQYDQNQPVQDVYSGQQHQTPTIAAGGITTPRFSEGQQEAQQLGPSSTPVQTPLTAVYPNSNGLRSGLPSEAEAGYYRREYRVQPQFDTESEQDQRIYDQSQQQDDHLPTPHVDAFVYPPHDRNASAAYPSHIPHLNQPVPQASPVFGSVPQGQGYEAQGGQGGYDGRYHAHPEYTLPAPAAQSSGLIGTATGGYYSTGFAGQPFSPIVPPLQGQGSMGHLDAQGTRSGYSSTYGTMGSTATGQWAESAGQYTMVHHNPPVHHAYQGQGPASYRTMGNSPEMRLSYLPPGSTGRGLTGIDPVESRKRSKFSSGSESLASPVYHSGSSSNRPYAARRPDMEADSGWSAEPSSSTTKMSSSLPAEGSGSMRNKGKRKTSGSASGGKSQPVFVTKLFTMLEDPAIARSGLLKWSQDGAGFICTNPTEFARLVLPQFFKHNNWHSFVRQLNMYGFSKQVNDVFLTLTTPSAQPLAWEFRHATFRRDDPEGIASIKRRSVKQTNQLRLQMEAEAAARDGPPEAAYARHTAYAQAGVPLVKYIKQERPSTTSPALSTTSASHRYAAVRYSHPTESGGLHGYAMHSAPVYHNEMETRSAAEGGLPASFASAWPRHVSHMPASAGTYETYRTPISATGSQYYPQPLSSASAVSQYPVLQPMGEPPVYQSMSYYEPDRPYVQALARQAGSISSQANHLAHEQEALKQNAEEIKQETGVILDSLSVSVDANQALPDARASRLREGIERLQDKVSEREKRISASLASSENIAAHAHALQGSLVAAASTTTPSIDGRGLRNPNYGSAANAWPSECDTLPPLQQSHNDADDRHTRTTPAGQHRPAMPNKQESLRTIRTTRSQSIDTDEGSERSHSRTRSGSGSGGIKELLN